MSLNKKDLNSPKTTSAVQKRPQVSKNTLTVNKSKLCGKQAGLFWDRRLLGHVEVFFGGRGFLEVLMSFFKCELFFNTGVSLGLRVHCLCVMSFWYFEVLGAAWSLLGDLRCFGHVEVFLWGRLRFFSCVDIFSNVSFLGHRGHFGIVRFLFDV